MKSTLVGALMLIIVFAVGCPIADPVPSGTAYYLNDKDTGHSITQTDDGGYFIVGTGANEGADRQVVTVKLAADGSVEWWRLYADLYASRVWNHTVEAVPVAGGGALAAGLTTYNSRATEADGHLRLVKTDGQGATLWDKTFGGDAQWLPQALVAASDGTYVVAGCSPKGQDVRLKVDGEGTVLWLHEAEVQGVCVVVQDMKEVSQSGFLISGKSWGDNLDLNGLDVALVRVDADGNELWRTLYEAEEDQDPHTVELASDGGFLIAGTTQHESRDRPLLMKTDADGTLLWWRDDILVPTWAHTDYDIWDMAVNPDDTVVLVGVQDRVDYAGPLPIITQNSFLIKLDASGDLLWYTNLGWDDTSMYGVTRTTAGTYMTVGGLGGERGTEALYLVEVDDNGDIIG